MRDRQRGRTVYNARRPSENLTAVTNPEADRETDIQAHTPENKGKCTCCSVVYTPTRVIN